MLWFVSLHIVFITGWFAGLFYLPRIFVNLAMVPKGSVRERERLLLMARKLLRFTTIIAVPAIGFGFVLSWGYGIGREGPGNGWLYGKIGIVVLSLLYQYHCAKILGQFQANSSKTRSHVWYRWYNEIPLALLFAAVALAVMKPF